MISANPPVSLPLDIEKSIIEAVDPDLSQFGFWRRSPFLSVFDTLTAERCNRLRDFALKNTALASSERESLVRAFRPAPNNEQLKQLSQKIDLFK